MSNKFVNLSQHSRDDEIISLCKRNHYFQRNNMIPNILNVSWKLRKTDLVGVGLENDDSSIGGFIGCLEYTFHNASIANLSCGIIDEKLRGKGHASPFFQYAFSTADIILDLSPTAQVYSMLLKHIPNIKQLTDYQIWVKPKRKKTKLRIMTDKKDVLSGEPDFFEDVYEDNIKYCAHFVKITDGVSSAVFGYYTFSRYVIRGLEIIYCSNQRFFEDHFNDVFCELNHLEHVFVCFCDHSFCAGLVFDGEITEFGTTSKIYAKRILKLANTRKGYIKTANRRLYWTRDGSSYDFPLGYLYSEVIFYHSSF